MTTILGVDPSMTATGLAVLRNGRVYTLTATSPSTEDAVTRWRRILAKIWREVEGSALIVVEELPLSHKGASGLQIERAGLLALVRYGADARGIPVALVNPLRLKVFATGHGRASKQGMTSATAGAFPGMPSPRNDNEADALWLLAMGCHRYMNPAVNPLYRTLSAKQQATVDDTRWPNWRFEP